MELEDLIKLSYTNFVKELKDAAGIEKVRALLKSGREDGLPDDEKISFSKGTVIVRNLTPCQEQLLIEASIKWSLSGIKDDELQKIINGETVAVNGQPVVVLNNKYVIDGHHRWVEAFLINPNARIEAVNMQINIDPIDALKIIQLSIAANAGDVPFSSPKGTNLYTMSESAFKMFVDKNVTESVLEIFDKDRKDLAEYLWEHLVILKKNNQPIKGAPDRVYMPQPSKANNSIEDIEAGKINYKKPFMKKENRIPSWDEFINEGKSTKMWDDLIGKKVKLTNTVHKAETEDYEITEIRYLDANYEYGITFTHLNPKGPSGQTGWGRSYFYHISDKELNDLKAGKKHNLTRNLYVEPS